MVRLFALFTIVLILLAGTAIAQDSPVSYLDGKTPGPQNYVTPAPAEASESPANPPSFVWLPEEDTDAYVLQYSRDSEFTDAEAVKVRLNVHQPRSKFEFGTWHWRYRAIDSDGTISEWSVVRSFTVPSDAVEIALPSAEDIRDNVLRGRPRIFVRPEGLEEFRKSRFSERKDRWEAFEKSLESRVGIDLMPEPEGYPNDQRTPELWRKYYRETRVMTNAMEAMAFGYLATGNREYAEEAKRIMLYLTTWDPNGYSRYRYEDEIAMPIAHSTIRAYDWIYDTLTPEERAKVVEMMKVRLAELHLITTTGPYVVTPYGSHLQRALMFLGEGCISFMGEIPECEEWLDYVLTAYFCLYPPWGGADGSYVEGPWYWGSYIGWALQFIDVLQNATGADLYGKPFFRNTGWYVLYVVPPHSQMQPFGDGAWFKPVSTLKSNMYRLSSVYDNPYFRWYADSHSSNLPNSHIMYLWQDDSITAKPPADLPQSRVFYDAGLVGMHSDLSSKDDISLIMRSSPGGAWSHAFADQNSFYLQAFGEALAIPSGYRPFSGDPHHATWTRQTKSSNSILVNGEGQISRSRASQGRIAEAVFSDKLDYACGDATVAYGGKLDKFLRHVLFMRPGYFILVDELTAPEASTFDWLLHAWEEMDVDSEARRVTTKRGDARLLTQFVSPVNLEFSQTDQFSAPTTNNPSLADQWHLTASTTAPSRERHFVTVLCPYKAEEEGNLPEIELLTAPGASGVTVSSGTSRDTVILNLLDSPMAGVGIRSDARLVAAREEGGRRTVVFMQGGKFVDDEISASSPVTLTMEIASTGRTISLSTKEAVEIRVKMEEPRRVELNGKEHRAHRFSDGTLTLSLPAGEHVVRVAK